MRDWAKNEHKCKQESSVKLGYECFLTQLCKKSGI